MNGVRVLDTAVAVLTRHLYVYKNNGRNTSHPPSCVRDLECMVCDAAV